MCNICHSVCPANHANRYVQLSVAAGKLPKEPTLDTVVGINLRTAAREQARQHYSDPTLQRLSDNSWWGEAAALMSIPNGAAGRGEVSAKAMEMHRCRPSKSRHCHPHSEPDGQGTLRLPARASVLISIQARNAFVVASWQDIEVFGSDGVAFRRCTHRGLLCTIYEPDKRLAVW
eukprot:SAG31_NODE_1508_length_8063_cov_3.156956_4_plen_175_part_00